MEKVFKFKKWNGLAFIIYKRKVYALKQTFDSVTFVLFGNLQNLFPIVRLGVSTNFGLLNGIVHGHCECIITLQSKSLHTQIRESEND